MITYKISFRMFICSLLMVSIATHTSSPTLRFLGGSLFIGTGLTVLEYADFKTFSRYSNISAEDTQAILSASIIAFGVGCLSFQDGTGTALQQWAMQAPCVAALAGIISSRPFKKFIAHVPGIGTYLGACSNIYCEGTCNKCKIRTSVATYTIWHYLIANMLEQPQVPV